jgi:peptide-methionine (S)-S-oxide reductase
VGTQYRSVILYHDQAQKEIAQAVIQEIDKAGIWGRPIVTEVAPLEHFYPAEDYHQDYYYNNPYQGYCRVIIEPKVSKFRKEFAEQLKAPA